MCTNGCGKGASGSSMMIASSTVPAGAPLQLKGGEIFSPTPIPAERSGICFPLRNDLLLREIISGTPEKRGVVRSGVAFPGADTSQNTTYPSSALFFIAIAIVHGVL